MIELAAVPGRGSSSASLAALPARPGGARRRSSRRSQRDHRGAAGAGCPRAGSRTSSFAAPSTTGSARPPAQLHLLVGEALERATPPISTASCPSSPTTSPRRPVGRRRSARSTTTCARPRLRPPRWPTASGGEALDGRSSSASPIRASAPGCSSSSATSTTKRPPGGIRCAPRTRAWKRRPRLVSQPLRRARSSSARTRGSRRTPGQARRRSSRSPSRRSGRSSRATIHSVSPWPSSCSVTRSAARVEGSRARRRSSAPSLTRRPPEIRSSAATSSGGPAACSPTAHFCR